MCACPVTRPSFSARAYRRSMRAVWSFTVVLSARDIDEFSANDDSVVSLGFGTKPDERSDLAACKGHGILNGVSSSRERRHQPRRIAHPPIRPTAPQADVVGALGRTETRNLRRHQHSAASVAMSIGRHRSASPWVKAPRLFAVEAEKHALAHMRVRVARLGRMTPRAGRRRSVRRWSDRARRRRAGEPTIGVSQARESALVRSEGASNQRKDPPDSMGLGCRDNRHAAPLSVS